VRFGALMEHARGRVADELPRSLPARLARWAGFRVVLPHRLALRLVGTLLSFARATGLVRLLGRLGENVPPVPRLPARRLLPEITRATGARRGGGVLLQGCVMPALYARVNRATARSRAALGYDGHAPAARVCCGSLHAHNGDLAGARALARRMVAVCEPLRDEAGAPLPVVVNSAGCGAHMKECWQLFEEEPEWRARARAFAARVVDYAELVAPRLADVALSAPGADELPRPITWDDPCHLCHGQGIRAEPRAILARLFGGELVPLENSEGCCGSAGLYALLRPEDSRAVFETKRADLAASGARTLVTANPGCQMQWETGLARAGDRVRVVHLAELVDRALNTAP
jgi:glycolate oxidase iron-sulfur subunit